MEKDWAEDDALTADEIRARIAGLERATVVDAPGNVRTGIVTKVKTSYSKVELHERSNLATAV